MRSKIFFAGLVWILFTSQSLASTNYFIYDKYWSPYAGANLMLSANNTYKFLDDYYLPSSSNDTGIIWSTLRLGKTFAQSFLAGFLTVTQHEFFGHGYRAREFGVPVGYEIKPFSGAIFLSSAKYNQLPLNQRTAVTAAGLEAEMILSSQLRSSWLINENIDNRDAILYAFNQTGAINYVYITNKNLKFNSEGNDIKCYIEEVNAWHQKNVLDVSKMRSSILWDLFDPALYNSLYGAFVSYVVYGEPTQKLYMLPVGQYKYLPGVRVLMAPYGLEYQVFNYIKTPSQQLWQVNVRYGSTNNIDSYGADLYIKKIWTYDNFTFGNKLSIWEQPQLNLPTSKNVTNKFGLANVVTLEYKLNEKSFFYGEVGYKMAGYVPGMPLSRGVVFGLGVNLII